MTLNTVLKEAEKLAIPSKDEQRQITSAVKEVTDKINKELIKQKINAKAVVGGSVAKDTWLPGLSDIDFFILFNYFEYSERSAELSGLTEKVLKKVFTRLQRLHGSRDYFSAKFNHYNLEFVPVLDISRGRKARNITDYSPLHTYWVVEKLKQSRALRMDIRLAKQFYKSAEVYGAESYIRGLSGYSVEILAIHYKGFLQLLKAAAKWPAKKVILDPQKHYKTDLEILQSLNPAKTVSPLILVDPVDKTRNAAAALSREKFGLMKSSSKAFLSRPALEFFKERIVTKEHLIKNKGKRKLIIFEAAPEKGKVDVIGARLLKLFGNLQNAFEKEDFTITKSGWRWNTKAMFWFYFDPKPLSSARVHLGPPKDAPEQFIKSFKARWKGVKIKGNSYVVEAPRPYKTPVQLAKKLAKEFKLELLYAE